MEFKTGIEQFAKMPYPLYGATMHKLPIDIVFLGNKAHPSTVTCLFDVLGFLFLFSS